MDEMGKNYTGSLNRENSRRKQIQNYIHYKHAAKEYVLELPNFTIIYLQGETLRQWNNAAMITI